MSKRQTLRGFVNERLAAAANEIFVLVERTITEYEEELCRFKEENRRKQQLLDLVLRSQAPGPSAEVHAPVLDHVLGPDAAEVQTECLSQKKEPSETPHTQVKEEPLEKSIKQEEGQFPEFTVCYVESEEQTSLRHTQPEPKDPQGEDKRRANSSSNPHGYVYSEYGQSDSDPSAHSSTTQHNTFTVEEDDHSNKIQTKYRNAAAHYSAQGTSHTSAPETSGIPMDENMSSVRIKEEPLEESIKEEEGQFPEFTVCYVESEEQMPLQHTQTELKDPQGEDTRRANSSSNPHGYVYSEYGQSDSDPSVHSSTAQIAHNSARGTSNTYPPETSDWSSHKRHVLTHTSQPP
uniref:Uncharacterized protein n=1 Tax=Knipowitschia caucasica TaxID=637954 RepID=A0AAV2K2V5_KNICA